MALRTRCIKSPRVPSDGLRISVMSRHTLNDGITLDPEITKTSFDQWWSELAPSDWLLGSYYKRGLPWADFELRFLNQLEFSAPQELLRELIGLARASNVTILCQEITPEQCHRRLIAEACQRMDPLLEVVVE